MKQSRRDFLKYAGIGTAVGLANIALETQNMGLVSLVKNLFEQKKQPITFYVSLSPNTLYTKEGFDLAKEYFKERVGLDVNFVYCDKDKIPELDHLTRFAVIETTKEKRAQEVYLQIQKETKITEADVDEDIARRIKRLEEENRINLDPDLKSEEAKNFADLMRLSEEEFEKWCKDKSKRNIQGLYEFIGAEAEGKKSTVYLMPRSDLLVEMVGKRNSERFEAMQIVHEIGHLAGLWHSFQFKNDNIEDYLPNQMANVMSYEMPLLTRRKYGFDLTESQIKQIKDYFNSGETYKKLEEHDFGIPEFIKATAKERNYK